jgi:hypothetical protein
MIDTLMTFRRFDGKNQVFSGSANLGGKAGVAVMGANYKQFTTDTRMDWQRHLWGDGSARGYNILNMDDLVKTVNLPYSVSMNR